MIFVFECSLLTREEAGIFGLSLATVLREKGECSSAKVSSLKAHPLQAMRSQYLISISTMRQNINQDLTVEFRLHPSMRTR